MSEVTKVVSAENAPINNSMNYAKKYEASYEDSGGGSGGDSDVLVVHIDIDHDHMTATFDKTFEEISNAVSSGKVVLAKDPDNDFMWLSFCVDNAFTFYGVNFGSASSNLMLVKSVNGDYENSVLSGTYYEYYFTLTPET